MLTYVFKSTTYYRNFFSFADSLINNSDVNSVNTTNLVLVGFIKRHLGSVSEKISSKYKSKLYTLHDY